jgi:5-aminolevulinate synthase
MKNYAEICPVASAATRMFASTTNPVKGSNRVVGNKKH